MLQTHTPVSEGGTYGKKAIRGALVVLTFAAVAGSVPTGAVHGAVGGPESIAFAFEAREREQHILQMRVKQAVLGRREEILRYQLRMLEAEYQSLQGRANSATLAKFRNARNDLVLLLQDQRQTEDKIVDYLRQLWDAQGRARIASMSGGRPEQILISWPVEPREGISAFFHDAGYEERFGIVHEAVDIPIEQESLVHAAADGVVEVVADNGMGYNYIIVRHKGFATLYGHVISFLVREGETVREGQAIALSGGQPGKRGSGAISTGPHVHFELIIDGEKVDPLLFLSYRRGVSE